MRKPVVCTAICGNIEMVHDKESGWVVAPGDAPALAQAMLEALGDPAEAARWAAKGHAWVLQHCTSAVRVEQIEQIYRAVLESSTSSRQRRKRALKVHVH
jgi:glycosyltransferase involved in cell wall biosynthesis